MTVCLFGHGRSLVVQSIDHPSYDSYHCQRTHASVLVGARDRWVCSAACNASAAARVQVLYNIFCHHDH